MKVYEINIRQGNSSLFQMSGWRPLRSGSCPSSLHICAQLLAECPSRLQSKTYFCCFSRYHEFFLPHIMWELLVNSNFARQLLITFRAFSLANSGIMAIFLTISKKTKSLNNLMCPFLVQLKEPEKVLVLWHLCCPETRRILKYTENMVFQNFFVRITIFSAAKYELVN